jgi:hypothetical protein
VCVCVCVCVCVRARVRACVRAHLVGTPKFVQFRKTEFGKNGYWRVLSEL